VATASRSICRPRSTALAKAPCRPPPVYHILLVENLTDIILEGAFSQMPPDGYFATGPPAGKKSQDFLLSPGQSIDDASSAGRYLTQ
jgi:hypothetical protein